MSCDALLLAVLLLRAPRVGAPARRPTREPRHPARHDPRQQEGAGRREPHADRRGGGKFWPVYDRYQGELNAVHDRLVKVIEDYTATSATSPTSAPMKLVEDYLAVEADRAKVRRAYLAEFAKVLPGRKVARFYQIENKMDAVVRYDLAAEIPVVEER